MPPPATPSSSGARPFKLAPYKERLAAAKSVKVRTDILGLEPDASLEAAHTKLDPLTDPAQRPEQEADDTGRSEAEQKVLWKLAKSDFNSVFVKADDKGRVTYILGLIRAGNEIPFDKIGQVEKAPIRTDRVVAWDVVRPNRPLIRVVARGSGGKANSITIFIVKRPPAGAR